MVRPQGNIVAPATGPAWQLGAGTLGSGLGAPSYELWTFQTAFRWIYPSVTADGNWTASLEALVQQHNYQLGRPVAANIDQTLWNSVVLGTHLDATGRVTNTATDPLAVFRAPWHTPTALSAPGNEGDLLQRVVYPQVLLDVAQVYREKNTVDVQIHHRDTRPVAAGHSFAVLMFREDASDATLLASDMTAFPAYLRSVLAADNAGTALPAAPAGWTIVTTGGPGLHRLTVRLDARMPRAVPIDVDLSGVTDGHFVLFLAFVGSDADPYTTVPVGLPATPNVSDLVTRWSPAAARLVKVARRP
jgi:hypothetical protein